MTKNVLNSNTPKFGECMGKTVYGSNEFFNRLGEILEHKYDKDIAVIMQNNVTLQHQMTHSILLIEILQELRKLNQAQVITPEVIIKKVVDAPINKVPSSGTGSPVVQPVSTTSAPSKP
jgi:hypothetical protein